MEKTEMRQADRLIEMYEPKILQKRKQDKAILEVVSDLRVVLLVNEKIKHYLTDAEFIARFGRLPSPKTEGVVREGKLIL